MADIEKISGHDVPAGGGLSAETPLTGAGTMLAFNGGLGFNQDVDYTFNLRAWSNHSFTKLAASAEYLTVWGIKSDGTLWYCATENTNVFNAITTSYLDGEWHKYGSATDWEDITSGEECFGAIKDGEYWFIGSGSQRQRGNGTTSSSYDWVLVNNAKTWVQVAMGEDHTVLRDSNGEVWTCGNNRDYATGQGTSSSYTSTLTREQNDLTGATWIAAGNYDSTCVISGQVYFTGQNSGPHAGFQSTSSSDRNGFTAVNSSITDVVSTHHHSRYSLFAITTNGSIRFAGYATSKGRPDNSTASQTSSTNQLSIISGAGTGWTALFGTASDPSGNRYGGIGFKSGTAYCGGDVFLKPVKALQGDGTNTTGNWASITNSATPSAASVGENIMVISWS